MKPAAAEVSTLASVCKGGGNTCFHCDEKWRFEERVEGMAVPFEGRCSRPLLPRGGEWTDDSYDTIPLDPR